MVLYIRYTVFIRDATINAEKQGFQFGAEKEKGLKMYYSLLILLHYIVLTPIIYITEYSDNIFLSKPRPVPFLINYYYNILTVLDLKKKQDLHGKITVQYPEHFKEAWQQSGNNTKDFLFTQLNTRLSVRPLQLF